MLVFSATNPGRCCDFHIHPIRDSRKDAEMFSENNRTYRCNFDNSLKGKLFISFWEVIGRGAFG